MSVAYAKLATIFEFVLKILICLSIRDLSGQIMASRYQGGGDLTISLFKSIIHNSLGAQILGFALTLSGCGDEAQTLGRSKLSLRSTKYMASTSLVNTAAKSMPTPSDSKDRGGPTDDGTNIDVDGGSRSTDNSDRDGDDGRNTNPWGGTSDNSGGVDFGSSGENPWGGSSDNSGGVAF